MKMSEGFYEARRKDGERRRAENSEWWTGDAATYTARHKRVVRQRGQAKNSECLHCGDRARDWAQLHGTDGLDVENDYIPLCRKCHIAYDESMKTRTKNHPTIWPGKDEGQPHPKPRSDSPARDALGESEASC